MGRGRRAGPHWSISMPEGGQVRLSPGQRHAQRVNRLQCGMFAADRFAREWVAAWNRGDVEAVLAHFAEDAAFISQTAAAVTGNAEVRGKPALRAYWTKALGLLNAPLRFELESLLWDPSRRAMLIVFLSAEKAGTVRKAELMQFGDDGLVHRGEGLVGAGVRAPAPPA